jgi:two-component system chemotaxis response regulator CheB
MGKVNVLIIDDSALVRQTLATIIDSDPQINVSAVASDPYIAVRKINENPPDVITLDIEMPRMDGLTFLKKLMMQHPIPVLVISTLTEKNTVTALQALEYGAVEVISKPKVNTKDALVNAQKEICSLVKVVAKANVQKLKQLPSRIRPKLNADAVLSKANDHSLTKTSEKVIAVGASTGGTEAIKVFLQGLPPDCPGILIVQHMPEMFTRQFAQRLNEQLPITVKEAKNGDSVIRGQALIAPGNHHMLLNRNGANYFVKVQNGPLVNRHRPSVDVLFRSVAKYAGANATGIILTGMGDDGARGLKEMRDNGAYTIAQNEASSVVFGMPKAAIQINAASTELPLEEISQKIISIDQNQFKTIPT